MDWQWTPDKIKALMAKGAKPFRLFKDFARIRNREIMRLRIKRAALVYAQLEPWGA